jgi:hypothetical protein
LPEGCLEHIQARLQRQDGFTLFVRRVWGEHPQQPVELELMLRFSSQDQVGYVRWIEGAPKNTDLQSVHSNS